MDANKKFSACCDLSETSGVSALNMPDILVRPSTITAIFLPNRCSMSEIV